MADIANEYGPRRFQQGPHSPLRITGFYLQALRSHFGGDGDNIADAVYRKYTWAAPGNGPETQITIEPNAKWEPGRSNARPAIFVRRNDWEFVRLGRNDKAEGYGFAEDGCEYYTAAIAGSHSLVVLANEDGEAEQLGWEVFGLVAMFANKMRESLGLLSLVTLGLGAPKKIKEASGSYAVVASQAYVQELSWSLKPDSPILRCIERAVEGTFDT